MGVSVQVVGDYRRPGLATALAEQVGGRAWVDDGSFGLWGNHMRAFGAGLRSGHSHVCVLQDDAVPVEGFLDAMSGAIAARPDHLISLYVGAGRPYADSKIEPWLRSADIKGVRWLKSQSLSWGVGVVMPTRHIPALLDFIPEAEDHYDNRLGKWWFRRTRSPIQYVWPSLVDHADIESLVGVPGLARKAYRIGVADDYQTDSAPLHYEGSLV